MILWLIWAIEREKTIPMLVFAVLTLLVKEDEPAEDEHYTMPKSENISTNLGSLLANLKL